jgi:hypothetical protein
VPTPLRPGGDDGPAHDDVLRAVRIAWDGGDRIDARGVRVVGGRAEAVDLAASRLPHLELLDVEVVGGSLANADQREATWRRVEVRGARLTGLRLTDARLEDVVLRDCRIDLAALSGARLRRVVLADCLLTGIDLQELAGEDLVLDGCDLREADLDGSRFTRTELRGCRLDGVRGLERLRGVGMRWEDVLENAGAFAGHLGIRLVDGGPHAGGRHAAPGAPRDLTASPCPASSRTRRSSSRSSSSPRCS